MRILSLMPGFIDILIIAFSSIILVKAVEIFVSSASRLARHFHISEYTISFLLIATATALPETIVGITSAIHKNPILSFGNTFGSSIALLTIIPAIPFIFRNKMSTYSIVRSRDVYYTAMYTILPLLLMLDLQLSFADGILLLIAYIYYAYRIIKRSRGIERLFDKLEQSNVFHQIILFVLSLCAIFFTSRWIVEFAQDLSSILGLGIAFIGMTITAIGTSLPEIAFTLEAARKNKTSEIFGDILGSVTANSTLVLGITAIIHPIIFPGYHLPFITAVMLILALAVFLRASETKEKIDRWEAAIMFIVYCLFILTGWISTVIYR